MNPYLRIWRLPVEFLSRFNSTLRLVLLLIGSLCIIMTVIVGFMTFFDELATWKLYVSIGFTSTLAVIYYVSYIDEYLSQRFFVLFVILAGCCIKLMAQAPVDDYGYIFIYCAPLLSMVYLTPRDTKLIVSVNTLVFFLMLILGMKTNSAGFAAINNTLFITHFALFVVLNYALPLSFRDLTSIDRLASQALLKENLKLRENSESLERMFQASRQAKAIVNPENSQLEAVNESLKALLGHAWQNRLYAALERQRSAIKQFKPVIVNIGDRAFHIEIDHAYSPNLRTLVFTEDTAKKPTASSKVPLPSVVSNPSPMLDRDGLVKRLFALGESHMVTVKLERTSSMSDHSLESFDSRSIQKFILRLRESFPASPLARLSRHVFVVVFNNRTLADVHALCKKLMNSTSSRPRSGRDHFHVCISQANGSAEMLQHIIDKSISMVHGSKNHLAYSFILNESQYESALEQRSKAVALLVEQKKFLTVFHPFSNSNSTIKGVETHTILDLPEVDDSTQKELLRIAKRNGQHSKITIYGLAQACRVLSDLARADRLPGDFLATVNLSVTELQSEAFVNQFLMTINKYTVRTQNIAIAISERALLECWDRMRVNVKILRSFGVRLAIRDVSSHKEILGTLIDAPVDCILLEGDFVNACLQHRENVSPLHLINSLCSELNIRVVARGVECKSEEADLLRLVGDIHKQCRHLESGLTGNKTMELLQNSMSV